MTLKVFALSMAVSVPLVAGVFFKLDERPTVEQMRQAFMQRDQAIAILLEKIQELEKMREKKK